MRIRAKELTGASLDWAVAKCDGVNLEAFTLYYHPTEPDDLDCHGFPEFHYSTVWAQGGPIIARENITIIRANNDYVDGKWMPNWFAETDQYVGHSASESYEHQQMNPTFMISAEDGMYGPTPLIAAMRAYVASKLGVEVDVPEELLK
ncbi:MAG: DUF2591 family protein [FCB group bacterium]|nr:DUF2591 family protein [FCB group bacterium]